MKNKPISIKLVFRDAFNLYKKYFLLLLVTLSIIELATLPSSKSEITDSLSFFYSVAGFLILIFMYAIATVYIDFHRESKDISFLETVRQVGRRFLPLLINTILFILLLLVGLVALIIPSILVYVIFSVAFYFVLLENKGPLESFGLSRALTKGNRMKILTIVFLDLLPLAVSYYLFPNYNVWQSIYYVVIGAFSVVLYYSLWRNLRAASSVK